MAPGAYTVKVFASDGGAGLPFSESSPTRKLKVGGLNRRSGDHPCQHRGHDPVPGHRVDSRSEASNRVAARRLHAERPCHFTLLANSLRCCIDELTIRIRDANQESSDAAGTRRLHGNPRLLWHRAGPRRDRESAAGDCGRMSPELRMPAKQSVGRIHLHPGVRGRWVLRALLRLRGRVVCHPPWRPVSWPFSVRHAGQPDMAETLFTGLALVSPREVHPVVCRKSAGGKCEVSPSVVIARRHVASNVRWTCIAGPDRILIGAADGLFALAAPWSRQGILIACASSVSISHGK